MKHTIWIVDVTNRDGVQTSRLGLSKLQKTMLNFYLNELGVAFSEFGFPTTNHETNYLNANLELVKQGIIDKTRLSGWLRAVEEDVNLAFKNVPGLQYCNLSMSTSDQMLAGKFSGKFNRKDIMNKAVRAVRLAKEKGALGVGVNAEDASRTDLDFLIEFAGAAKEAGAVRFRYCDTLGYDTPDVIYDRIRKIAEATHIAIELHCHNDLGMAVANSVMGAKGAVDGGSEAFINTTVNGVGERAGNADLVSCLLAIVHGSGMQDYKLNPNIRLNKAWQLAKYASYAFGVPIPINQPAVGANAFAHESGIHADGALKDRRNYELYDFEELGRGEPEVIETGRVITTGEYGGIKGFRNVYEKLELEFKNDAHAREILELVRYANVHNQLPLVESELRFIYHHPDIAAKVMTITPHYLGEEKNA